MKNRMMIAAGSLALLGRMTPAERAAGRFMRGPDGEHPPAPPASAAEMAAEVKKEIKSTYEKVDKKTEDLAQVIDQIKKAVEGKADTTDLEGRLKDLQVEVKKAVDAADEVDKKLSRPRGGETEGKSAGQFVGGSDQWKSMQQARRGSTGRIELKAITLAGTAIGGQTVQALGRAERAPLITLPQRPVTVRALLAQARTSQSAVEFPKMTGFTNGAAPVAELALKPESNMTFSMETVPVRTLAHWIPASKQVLDDTPMLESLIDTQLRYGLDIVEDAQILLGDGTGQNLEGIIPQATAFSDAGIPAGATTYVDRIRWAKLQARKAFLPADGVILNPEDWAIIELLKDAQDRYLFSAFTSGAEQRLWGLRVVESDAIAPGSFLVGAFGTGAQIWDREEAGVEVSTEDRDNFVKNAVTIRAEERLALTVYRPNAFITGDLAAA